MGELKRSVIFFLPILLKKKDHCPFSNPGLQKDGYEEGRVRKT